MTHNVQTMMRGFAADLRGEINAARKAQEYHIAQNVAEVAFTKMVEKIKENPFETFWVVSVNTTKHLNQDINPEAALTLFRSIDVKEVNHEFEKYGLTIDEIRTYSNTFIQFSLKEITKESDIEEEEEDSYI